MSDAVAIDLNNKCFADSTAVSHNPPKWGNLGAIKLNYTLLLLQVLNIASWPVEELMFCTDKICGVVTI